MVVCCGQNENKSVHNCNHGEPTLFSLPLKGGLVEEFKFQSYKGQPHSGLVAVLQPDAAWLVAQARYCSSFQLTHMWGPCSVNGVSNGGQTEDKNLLQHSQLRQHCEFRHVSISGRQRSHLCGQNLCGACVRAVLATNSEESDRAMVADGTT